jgi:myo-inositol-1(or 4)-monophosphatase
MKKIILPKDINRLEMVAKLAVRAAGAELAKRFEGFKRSTITRKSRHEILTPADLASEKIILGAIKANFPEHRVLSEEAGNNYICSDYLWIIDPLDGTTNFSIHNPLWSLSIGLAYQGEIILGVIYVPLARELYSTVYGRGARLNGKKIHVSAIKDDEAIHAFCHGSSTTDIKRALAYYERLKLSDLDIRQLGSAAIELADVACGRLESIAIPGARSWDVAAGALLVREAGGRVTNFKNHQWNLEKYDLLASNGLVHKRLADEWKNIKIT